MNCFDLFPTKIWMGNLDLPIHDILNKIDKVTRGGGTILLDSRGLPIVNDNPHSELSFLIEAFKENIPKREGYDVGDLYVHYWINYNKPGDFNKRHSHTDPVILFSGCYYVKVPKDSGRIIFHDPRGSSVNPISADSQFIEYDSEITITPEEGMILYFPSWLEHEVETNLAIGMDPSEHDRISIAFNIISKNELERYNNMENLFDKNAIATKSNGNTEFFAK